jgi:hypothetical protein
MEAFRKGYFNEDNERNDNSNILERTAHFRECPNLNSVDNPISNLSKNKTMK